MCIRLIAVGGWQNRAEWAGRLVLWVANRFDFSNHDHEFQPAQAITQRISIPYKGRFEAIHRIHLFNQCEPVLRRPKRLLCELPPAV